MSDFCRICETRRPRRNCPGVGAAICAPCCGEEREVTVDCPFDCEYLREARRHDQIAPPDPASLPNQDIRVPEEFLAAHQDLLMAASHALFLAAAQTPGAIDHDVREALEALIKTYRTLDSGLIYESRPANPLAAGIQQLFEQRMNEFRQAMNQQAGISVVRDTEVLGILVFLQRLERYNNNGRRRGRAFLDVLRHFAPSQEPPPASNLVTA